MKSGGDEQRIFTQSRSEAGDTADIEGTRKMTGYGTRPEDVENGVFLECVVSHFLMNS